VSSCGICAAGKYQSSTGATSCESCPSGQSSEAGATSCETEGCSAGQYQDMNGDCHDCSSGQYQVCFGRNILEHHRMLVQKWPRVERKSI
jgi:hypothetical protein